MQIEYFRTGATYQKIAVLKETDTYYYLDINGEGLRVSKAVFNVLFYPEIANYLN